MLKALLQKIIRTFDHGCESVARISSVSLDRRLTLRERFELHMHFLMCDFCRRYHRQINILQKVATDVAQDEQGSPVEAPGLDEQARDRIRCAISQSVDDPQV